MISERRLARPRSWLRLVLQLMVAFLLGVPVGFLFRSIITENGTPILPKPSLLSLWGMWQVPVMLFSSLILIKILYFFVVGREGKTVWRILFAFLVLLFFTLLFICGIAPMDALISMGLYWDRIGIAYPFLNPFIVGLATCFILEETDAPSFSMGKETAKASCAWIGTVTLFFVLLNMYGRIVSPTCIRFDCITINLAIDLAPLEFLLGLVIAVVGGGIGGLLCHYVLGRGSGDSGQERVV